MKKAHTARTVKKIEWTEWIESRASSTRKSIELINDPKNEIKYKIAFKFTEPTENLTIDDHQAMRTKQ